MQQHYIDTQQVQSIKIVWLQERGKNHLATPSDRWHVGTRKTEQLLKLAERYEMLVIPA